KDLLSGMKREVLTGGGIKEWCTVSGKQAEEILKHIGENPQGNCTIRLHGKDYYKDIDLSKLERIAFILSATLWHFDQQRRADLAKAK
ncbi:MAG: hypothetical protein ABGZ24_12595, partial [Fuerstiella sp.]